MSEREKSISQKFRELTTPKELIIAEDCFNSKISEIESKHSEDLANEEIEINKLFILSITNGKTKAEIQSLNVSNDVRAKIYDSIKAAFISCYGKLGK